MHQDGSVTIDEKLRSGVDLYQQGWGDEVVLVARAVHAEAPPTVGLVRVAQASLGFRFLADDDWAEGVRAARPDLLVAPLVPRAVELAEFIDRTVFVAELPPEEHTRWELVTAEGAAARARVRFGGRRRTRLYEALVRAARGVQCNGYPAHERFRRLSAAPLLFFDTRLKAEQVELARAVDRPPPTLDRARLCFSGRLAPSKGPRHAVALARALQREHANVELVIVGAGELAPEIADGGPIRVRGPMRFDDEWTSFVRNEIDIMVLPHLLGDPSGTYLEAIGCGAPVLGYDNVALSSLVGRHGVGWTAPMPDTSLLTDAALRILADPIAWTQARTAGLDFMSEHHVDAEFGRRLEHLRALSTS